MVAITGSIGGGGLVVVAITGSQGGGGSHNWVPGLRVHPTSPCSEVG